MFDVGDIVRCILIDAGGVLVSNKHYIIMRVLMEYDPDDKDFVGTPLVIVSEFPTLTPIGRGFFITRFEGV